MLKPEKQQLVQDISDKFSRAKAFFFTDFSGLNVEQITELRSKFREKSIEYHVVKNTLTRLALRKLGFETLSNSLLGPTAIAFSYDDPTAPAKIISEFLKANRALEKPTIKVCVVEKNVLSGEQAADLINLPSRETLIAMVLGGINAPLTGLVSTLNGMISKLILTLKALEDQKNQIQT